MSQYKIYKNNIELTKSKTKFNCSNVYRVDSEVNMELNILLYNFGGILVHHKDNTIYGDRDRSSR